MKTLAALALLLVNLAGRPSWLNSRTERIESYLADPVVAVNQPVASPSLPRPIKSLSEPIELQAKSVLAIDSATNQTLYAKNSHQPLPIASITKLVSVLVIIQSHSLNEVITIPPLPVYQPADSRLGLVAGQRFNLSELLEASLVPSANDAMDGLALADSGGLSRFITKMNELAGRWQIDQTHFNSPTGLTDQNNYSTAASLVKIARLALINPTIRQLVDQSTATITDLAGQTYSVTSTNQLLQNERFNGIKTGYTPAAGQSLVALAEINGHQVIAVVLNSPDRFAETQALINWIERNYQWL